MCTEVEKNLSYEFMLFNFSHYYSGERKERALNRNKNERTETKANARKHDEFDQKLKKELKYFVLCQNWKVLLRNAKCMGDGGIAARNLSYIELFAVSLFCFGSFDSVDAM